MTKIISALLLLSILASCTKDFKNLNRDQNQISDDELTQDNNLVGSPFSSMVFNLFGHQIDEALCYDSWM